MNYKLATKMWVIALTRILLLVGGGWVSWGFVF